MLQALAHVEVFAKTSSYMQENGLDSSQIWLDPGSFGKDDSANLSLWRKHQTLVKNII